MRFVRHANMILHCSLLILFLNCVKTTEYYDYGLANSVNEFDQRFSFWPSIHNAARVIGIRKREAEQAPGPPAPAPTKDPGPAPVPPPSLISPVAPAPSEKPVDKAFVGHSDGGIIELTKQPPAVSSSTLKPTPLPPADTDGKTTKKPGLPEAPQSVNKTGAVANTTETSHNGTASGSPTQLDLNNPGVMKRGIIVFGGFLLLAVAYFIFYRRKSNKNDTNKAHNANDANQFRYGVLQSEDRRDNLELSRIPLTMDSDEDEDEDLEIFDLEQKKKSLSYVNLQTNDEDIVFNNSVEKSKGDDKDNLLLDIEDEATDTLIDWTNNGNKSIL